MGDPGCEHGHGGRPGRPGLAIPEQRGGADGVSRGPYNGAAEHGHGCTTITPTITPRSTSSSSSLVEQPGPARGAVPAVVLLC
jgi:hypothetical protein